MREGVVRKTIHFAGLLALAFVCAPPLAAQTPAPPQNPVTAAPLPDVLSLEVATDRFLKRNLTLEAARLEVGVAEAERVAARLRPRPGISITGENLGISGPTAFNRLYEVGATIQQSIELGGRVGKRKEVAERTVALAEARLADVLQRRLLDLRRGYFEAVLARANLEIARENRTGFDELVRLNTTRLKEGDVAEGELIRVRLEKVKFDNSVAAAALAYEQAKVRLLELLGETDYGLAGALDLREPLQFIPVMFDLARLRETALANRPEVKIAEMEQALAAAVLELEESRGKGEIIPFVGYKRVGVDDTVLAGVTIPLPFGNRNQGGIARAAAQRQVAGTNVQLARNRVLSEVEVAYLAYTTARDQVRAYESGLLDQAQESVTITLAAYREGVTPLLNLFDAQRTRSEVRSGYLKALYDYRNSLFTLEQVIGTEIK
jgi:cobalt-zinc-cadmium efflux system outer membrane protein